MHSPSLIPDAADLLSTFLSGETDATCKRNAFAALSSIDHDAALVYLSSVFDGIPNADDLLQLVELEFIRKDAVQNSQNKVGRICEQAPPAKAGTNSDTGSLPPTHL